MIANDLINMASRAAGVLGTGQTMPAEMTATAQLSLNMILGQWAAKRWLTYHTVNYPLVSTGAASYTVGPGGDFNVVARPQNIEAAFVSQNNGAANQIDTPLQILTSREDYNRIALKSVVSMPSMLFYDNAMPLGTVYFWPVPNATRYSMTLTLKGTLPTVTTLLADMGLPPEFDEALLYNLACRIRTLYQMGPDPVLIGLAKAGLGTIRQANAQIPRLQIPTALTRGARYNVYSDAIR